MKRHLVMHRLSSSSAVSEVSDQVYSAVFNGVLMSYCVRMCSVASVKSGILCLLTSFSVCSSTRVRLRQLSADTL